MPVHARIGIWVAFLLLLVLIIVGIVFWQRRRARRQRDAIATVEAGQVDGPPPTPFESGFLQVPRPPVSCPAPAYHSYGPRTGVVPKSAYSIGFTPPRSANMPKRPQRDSYSTASHYSITPEDDVPHTSLPPPAATRGFRGPGLPVNPRPAGKYSPAVERKAAVEPTPRDKNTRFVIPELPRDTQKKERREWQVRLEALRSAPIKKSGFEVLAVPAAPTQSRSAGVAGALSSKLRPLFAGTGRL
ncbi:hypothetical protein M378DRAFT_14860 [Amanita muscaria Koide BX008]|uniref:Uncharacterized protein n=1 Tax=Amanita muscaria (strain Koide BX008) TaxID=946122 RepID=A0A0C2WSK8_AMAMK|nr:hypothetical protein M378DRAFT_14860 [Amanita muscaria Koide BX008]